MTGNCVEVQLPLQILLLSFVQLDIEYIFYKTDSSFNIYQVHKGLILLCKKD